MHTLQNVCKTCMTKVISKGSETNSDLLCDLETYKNLYLAVIERDVLCGSPVSPLCITLCVPFCN